MVVVVVVVVVIWYYSISISSSCSNSISISIVVEAPMYTSIYTYMQEDLGKKTPLHCVSPILLFLWPIYRLLLLVLCYYYYYQVLYIFHLTPVLSIPPIHRHCRRSFRLIAYNVELFIARQLCETFHRQYPASLYFLPVVINTVRFIYTYICIYL